MLLLAFVASALAATTGWIYDDGSGGSLVELHRWLGVSTASVLAIAVILSFLRRKCGEGWGPLYLLAVLAAAILAGITGHFGGEMVRGRGWVVAPLMAEDSLSPPSSETTTPQGSGSEDPATPITEDSADPTPTTPVVTPIKAPDGGGASAGSGAEEPEESATKTTPSPVVPSPPIPPIPTGLDESVINAGRAALIAIGGVAQPLGADAPWLEVILTRVEPSATDEVLTLLASIAPLVAHLNLSGTAITDGGMPDIGSLAVLRQCRLDRTKITTDGVKLLLPAPYLTTLNLFGTDVDDHVVEVLLEMPSLRHVFLAQTSVTQEAIAQLTALLPHVRVYGPAPHEPTPPTPPERPVPGDDEEKPPATQGTEPVPEPKIAP
jgi:hypothetical protein